MTTLTTSTGIGNILPPEYGDLIVNPVTALSLAFNPAISTVAKITGNEFYAPILEDMGGGAWVQEGAEIAPDDATFSELTVRPSKIAALRIISRELADDSSPAAAKIIGDSLAEVIANNVDKAFFGNLPAPAPLGLTGLPDISTVTTTLTNTDGFAEAIAVAADHGATVTAFVASSADALTAAKLKQGKDSNAPLLAPSAMVGTSREVLGVPLFSSPHVPQGTIWALDGSKQITVLRTGTEVAISKDAYFSSDRVGIRGTMRVGFAHPKRSAVVKIIVEAGK